MQWVIDMSRRPFVRRSLVAVLAVFVFTACQPDASRAADAPLATLAQAPAAGSVTPPARV